MNIEIIYIKNSKGVFNGKDFTLIVTDQGETIGVILQFKKTSYRRVHQGSNRWDCFKIFVQDGYFINETHDDVEGSIFLGRYCGKNEMLSIYKYHVSLWGNVIRDEVPVKTGTSYEITSETFPEVKNIISDLFGEGECDDDFFRYQWSGESHKLPFPEGAEPVPIPEPEQEINEFDVPIRQRKLRAYG